MHSIFTLKPYNIAHNDTLGNVDTNKYVQLYVYKQKIFVRYTTNLLDTKIQPPMFLSKHYNTH